MTAAASITSRPSSARSETSSRLSSANTRSAATPGSPGAAARASATVVGLDGEVELARQPRQAQRPQRVTLKRVRRDRTHTPRAQIIEPARGIDQRALAGERLRNRVDGQVTAQQILLDRVTFERQQVDLPAPFARDHAPGAELIRERERVRRGGAAERARDAPDLVAAVRRDDDVVVGRPASQQPVAERAADEPCVGNERRDRIERLGHGAGGPSR